MVYDELHQTQPTGLRYTTFRLDDGRNLALVAVDETLRQRNPLLEVAAFRRFTDGIAGRLRDTPADRRGGPDRQLPPVGN